MFTRRASQKGKDGSALRESLDRSFCCVDFSTDGTILGANANFLQAMGYSLAEVAGKHHRIFLDRGEAEGPAYRDFWSQLASGVPQSGLFRRIGKDGAVRWLEAVYNPIRDGRGTVTHVTKVAKDITARRLENELNAGRLAALDKSQAIIEFNPDGTIVTANDIFCRVMGYGLADLKGKSHSIFVEAAFRDSPDYRDFWNDLRAGKHKVGLFKRIARGGGEVWLEASYNPVIDSQGKVIRVVKFATDVTAARMEAADNTARLSALDRSQAVIEFQLDGTIINANANFLKALGYSSEEVRGKHHSMFVEPAERDSAQYRAFWDKLRRGEFEANLYKRIGKGGRIVWIEASYNPVLDAAGKPLKVVKFATDVTAKVHEAEKNKRISDMLQSVAAGAEELNVSVREISSSMASSSQAAGRATGLATKADEASQRLAKAAEAMGGIVDAINNITGQINLLALNATIESARAGEAGRGFAVVAGEVKNLANQAKAATERISGEIDGMRGISGDVGEALEAMRRVIDELHEYVNSTAAAIEEQSTVASEMSANMQQAASQARVSG
jgi:methyl-accepting chemotaxis protein